MILSEQTSICEHVLIPCPVFLGGWVRGNSHEYPLWGASCCLLACRQGLPPVWSLGQQSIVNWLGFRRRWQVTLSRAYFTKESDPSLAKPPRNLDSGLAKLALTSLVKQIPKMNIKAPIFVDIPWPSCLQDKVTKLRMSFYNFMSFKSIIYHGQSMQIAPSRAYFRSSPKLKHIDWCRCHLC